MTPLPENTRITVRLSRAEAAKLDEFRLGLSRPAYLRRLLADVAPDQALGVATRDEALAILTSMARDGKVAAAIALERAVRGSNETADVPAWLRD